MTQATELRPLKRLGRALALAGLLAASLPSHAVITQVFSRAALGGTDTLTWSQLGADGLELTPPQNVLTTALAAATVSNSAGSIWRFDEGASWGGSFAVGAQLLSTFGNAGPLVISFANPVARVGTQIQSVDYGSFTGVLEAFNAANVSLGSVSIGGVSDNLQVNTSPFLGLVSTALDIKSVRFTVTGTPNLDFGINQVDISVTPVPEPSAYLMMLAGGVVLAGIARRRRKAAAD